MGYPYDKSYYDQIVENKEYNKVYEAYNVLVGKYLDDHEIHDSIDLTIPEMFQILGEAFKYGAPTLEGISDEYHFMSDILYEILEKHMYKDKKKEEDR